MSVDILLILVLVIALAAVFNSTVKATPSLKRKKKGSHEGELRHVRELSGEKNYKLHEKKGRTGAASAQRRAVYDEDVYNKPQTSALTSLNKKDPKQMASVITAWVSDEQPAKNGKNQNRLVR
ncbi:MAG: hypothetical protein EOL87_15215 [Spartobacteria bacterium]|nr:hypothetical protein [Spartobacteria bacterium]